MDETLSLAKRVPSLRSTLCLVIITGSLEVDRETINAAKVIIATGSRPNVPAITGIEQVPYLTSTTALELEQLPVSLLVIGAGYIGVEIAQIFARAKAAGYEVRTSVLTLDNVPRALAARDTRGLIKLVADGKSNRLLGAHILAPEGADSIQTTAVAIKMGMTYQQLAEMIFP